MTLVEWVPVERLRTTLLPLRGERTEASELAPMPLRVAAREDGGFEVLDGFKRLARWSQDRGEVPVVIEPAQGPALKARLLDANTPRKTASPMDEARVVAALAQEDGLSVPSIAKLLGRKPPWVERRLTLGRRLAKDLAPRVDRGRLSLSLALALSAFAQDEQLRLAGAIERHFLTTRETEAFLATYRAADPATREALLRDPRSGLPPSERPGASPLGRTAGEIASRMDEIERGLLELSSADFSGLLDSEQRVLEARRRQLLLRLELFFKEATHGPRPDPGDPGSRPAGPVDPRDRQEAGNGSKDDPQDAGPGSGAAVPLEARSLQGESPGAPLPGPDRPPDPPRDPGIGLRRRPQTPPRRC